MGEILTTRKQKLADLRRQKNRARHKKVTATTLAGAFTVLTLMGTKASACSTEYTVKKGDTLYSLAKRYQVSVQQLMDVNGLSSERIYVDQELLVPDELLHDQSEEMAGRYTVKKGDTLFSLSKKFQISMKLLMVANGLTTENIKIGQTLLVPYETPVTNDSPVESSEDLAGTYTVKKGDTLFSLAHKFHISVNELIKENKLQSDKIYVGQKLLVPTEDYSKETDDAVYTVAPGDTLWGIAKRFGVKVEDLKNDNSLISDGVIIGQKLHIPGVALFTEVEVIGAADSTTVEFDKSGDSLNLTVPYGTASDYQELSGQKITVIHQNGALISFI